MLGSQLKLAFKVLLRRKFFTFISLFGISFTLLVLMVAAAVLEYGFGPQPVERNADRSLYVTRAQLSGPNSTRTSDAGYLLLDRYARTLPNIERLAIASQANSISTYVDGRKVTLYLRHVDDEWWRALSYEFVEGSPYGTDDERNGNRVAVINEAMRETLFGGGAAVGKAFPLYGESYRVVGVVQNVPMTRYAFADVWVPIRTYRNREYERELLGGFVGVIVARSRADLPALQAEFAARIRTAELPDPKTYEKLTAPAQTLPETVATEMFDLSDAGLMELFAIATTVTLLFMLLPAVNLVNINLSRILERSSEIGVRKAFGASSRRLVGQFVLENVTLTFVGGAIGLALAGVALAIINRSGVIPYAQLGLNLRIFAYGLVLSLVFGCLSGVYPAWRMSRLHPVEALRGRF